MALSDIDNLPFDPNEGDAGHDIYHSLIHRGMKSLKDLEQSTDSTSLKIIGNQTISGSKTFSSNPIVPAIEWLPVDNWNMESDSGWHMSSTYRSFDDTESYAGTRSLKLTGYAGINDATSTGDNIFPVVPGETYYCEAMVKWDSLIYDGTGAAITLGSTVTRTSGETWPSFANVMTSAVPNQPYWIKISGYVTINWEDAINIKIRPSVRSEVQSGDVWFDQIKFARVNTLSNFASPSKSHIDLWGNQYETMDAPGIDIPLINQDFEFTTGWATSSTRNFDTTRSYEGIGSYRLNSAPGATVGEVLPENYKSVSPGEVYYAEAYMWWEDIVWTSSQGPRIEFSIHNSDGIQIAVLPAAGPTQLQALENSTDWVKFSGMVTMPANAATLRARCSIREGVQTGGTVWFDRYRLRKVENQTALYYRGDKTWQLMNRQAAGLGNVDNTSDLNKPISTLQQAALSAKQDYIEPTMSSGFEDNMYGWHVNNNMTISSEFTRTGGKSAKYTGGAGYGEIFTDPFILIDGQSFALSGYIYHPGAPTNHGFRIQARGLIDGLWGDVASSASNQSGVWEYESINYTFNSSIHDAVRARVAFSSDNTAYVDDMLITIDGVPYSPAGVPQTGHYFRGDKAWSELNKGAVGLSNVDNTEDQLKPISTAQQAALDLKQPALQAGETYQYARGNLTWQTMNGAAAGLGNVNNTSDLDKPISNPTQTALNAKATTAETLLLSGNQTLAGVKTFSSSPKLPGTPTVGQVWHASSTDGTGQWQTLGVPETTVDWGNITGKPSTFAPIIGTSSDTAAPGNHTHTKSNIGLDQVDNTSDASKPISNLTQAALDTKVSTSRTISTSANFSGGGNLGGNLSIAIASGGVDLTQLDTASKRTQIVYVQTLDTREVGYGQIEDGIKLTRPLTITSVSYRMGTADASGTTTCHIRKNGVAVSGTSATASTNPSDTSGSWSFAKGDVLSIYTSAVGTTPGKRLTAEMVAILS